MRGQRKRRNNGAATGLMGRARRDGGLYIDYERSPACTNGRVDVRAGRGGGVSFALRGQSAYTIGGSDNCDVDCGGQCGTTRVAYAYVVLITITTHVTTHLVDCDRVSRLFYLIIVSHQNLTCKKVARGQLSYIVSTNITIVYFAHASIASNIKYKYTVIFARPIIITKNKDNRVHVTL